MTDHVREDLLLDYLDGRLAPAESGAVARHLDGCAGCRAAADDLDSLRRAASGSVQPGSRADEAVLASIRGAIRFAATPSVPATVPRPRRRGRSWAASAGAAFALAVVLGAVWLGSLDRPPAPSPGVAVIRSAGPDVTVTRGGVAVPAVTGMPLSLDDAVSVPTGSAAVFQLDASDARVEVGPETVVSLAAGDGGDPKLDLRDGLVSVEVAESGEHPMHVSTPTAEADSSGGRFTVSAGRGRTAVRVAAGSARLTRRRDGAGVDVTAGRRSLDSDRAMTSAATRTGTVLVVVSPDRAPPEWDRFHAAVADRVIGRRVRELGFQLEFRSHGDLRAEDLVGRPLVIASLSEADVGFEDSLRRVGLPSCAVPVLCFEPLALPALGMTGGRQGADFAWSEGDGTVRFLAPAHPLSAGLEGERVEAGGAFVSAGWGRPAAAASTIVAWADDPAKVVAFAYERGARMADRTAPARRVALLINPSPTAEDAGDRAWVLFEAAIDWLAVPDGIDR